MARECRPAAVAGAGEGRVRIGTEERWHAMQADIALLCSLPSGGGAHTSSEDARLAKTCSSCKRAAGATPARHPAWIQTTLGAKIAHYEDPLAVDVSASAPLSSSLSALGKRHTDIRANLARPSSLAAPTHRACLHRLQRHGDTASAPGPRCLRLRDGQRPRCRGGIGAACCAPALRHRGGRAGRHHPCMSDWMPSVKDRG
jgi:hypothetical protein